MLFMICFLGQRLSDQSEKLLVITYECDWNNQLMGFRRNLMIMRTICQKSMQLKTVSFILNRECFITVRVSRYLVTIMTISKTFRFRFATFR
jgi:hypothetical protein